LAWVASRNPETGNEIAGRYGVPYAGAAEEAVARGDADAVAICTNNDAHAAHVRCALNAGLHVFCEYPLALNASDAEDCAHHAAHHDRVLHVAHNDAFSPVHRALRRIIDERGPVRLFTFERLTPGSGRPRVLFHLRRSGHPCIFFIYHVFPVLDLLGVPEQITATGNYTGLDAAGCYDAFVNTLTARFPGGAVAVWTWAGGIALEEACESRAWVLDRGSVIWEPGGVSVSDRSGRRSLETQASDDPWSDEWQRFRAEIEGTRPVAPDPTEAVMAVRVCAEAAAQIEQTL
jgi:predicted dehydrogenase